jgi:type IX secretion system substrate protein/Big-like domain-containing protein/NHL repeat-containing protein
MNKILLFASIAIFLSLQAQSQTIVTVCGNGTGGYSGDGIPATTAELFRPWGVVSDGAGNYYIGDLDNSRVRKVSSSGIITTVAGTGFAGYSGDGAFASSSELNGPYGLALDASGNLYIADNGNYRIRKVNTAGYISTVAGTGTGGFSGDGFPATNAEIGHVNGIAVDTAGNLYIADYYNYCVRMVNTSGIISTIAGTGGVVGEAGDGGPATNALMGYVNNVAVDNSGNVYISDFFNNKVRIVNKAGFIFTFAGNGSPGSIGDGGPATNAQIQGIGGILADVAGNVYLGDVDNNKVRVVNAAGIINTYAGTGTPGFLGDGGPAIAAEFNRPNTLAFECGNMYVVDINNNRIREIVIINHAPHFTNGDTVTLSVCENAGATSLNSLLTTVDSDLNQSDTWSVLSAPLHGTVVGSYSTAATGGMLTPAGLSYTPATGYKGLDTFMMLVADCDKGLDTTTVVVTVKPLPNAGAILGVDSVCPNRTITLSDTAHGGLWTSSNTAISRIGSATGIVIGVSLGIDTISYSLTVAGCTSTVLVALDVRIVPSCREEVSTVYASPPDEITVYPNPAYTGQFTVNFSSGTVAEAGITITNMMGEKIREFNASANVPVDIKLDAYPGVYFLSAVTSSQIRCVKVIVR